MQNFAKSCHTGHHHHHHHCPFSSSNDSFIFAHLAIVVIGFVFMNRFKRFCIASGQASKKIAKNWREKIWSDVSSRPWCGQRSCTKVTAGEILEPSARSGTSLAHRGSTQTQIANAEKNLIWRCTPSYTDKRFSQFLMPVLLANWKCDWCQFHWLRGAFATSK